MRHQTREVLGRLAGWWVLAVCGGVGLAGVAMVAWTGLHTLDVADKWAISPDYVARQDRYVRFRVKGPLSSRAISTGFYLRGLRREILSPVTNPDGLSFVGQGSRDAPDRMVLCLVPNPYSGCVPIGANGWAFLWPNGTELLLLDVQALPIFHADGTLVEDAEDRGLAASRIDVLRRLSELRPLAYLISTPLGQYDRARAILRRAPAGAVLAAASQWAAPAGLEDMAYMVNDVRWHLQRWPLLATEDPELARSTLAAQRARGYMGSAQKVFLVGPHPPLPAPGVNVPDWNALAERLSGP